VGITPILLKNIVRYKKSLRALNVQSKQDMAGLAFEQGYYCRLANVIYPHCSTIPMASGNCHSVPRHAP
jgi:hypothetical protein